MNRLQLSLIGILLAITPAMIQAGPAEDYFETKVRPLLANRCFECHGEKKQESNVRLDRKATLIHGGGSGPLVMPGDVDASRLWQVIQHDSDDVQMPPEEKLSPEELEIIRHWIEQGAPWPDTDSTRNSGEGQPLLEDGTFDFSEAVVRHWSYRSLGNVPVPVPQDAADCRTPIDCFLAVSQQQQGLRFAPLAGRDVLIRRIAIDLLGIPPTYEEVQSFIHDHRPDALERLVDHCLAQPGYGERWGRHWLDVARYADTRGYITNESRLFPFSYTYRDYVIRSFNDDVPYNQFLLEQLAADRLGYANNDPRLSALGFLTVGNRFQNRTPDVIDDRIDVVTRGLMGMTVACARCHDHKYDPIPMSDYYALYGIFNNSVEPELGPIIGIVDESTPEYQDYAAELSRRHADLQSYIDTTHEQLQTQLTDDVADCLLGAARAMKLISGVGIPFADKEPPVKLQERWKTYIESHSGDGKADPVWIPWKTLMGISDAEFADCKQEKLKRILEDESIPASLRSALQEADPNSHLEVAQTYGTCFAGAVDAWKQKRAQSPEVESSGNNDQAALWAILFGQGSVSDVKDGENSPLFEQEQRVQIRRLQAKISEWHAESSGSPARAMVLADRNRPSDTFLFLRGDPNRPGDKVTRHAPRILEPLAEQPFQSGSGRLELARAIVSESNPLTARVIVNRVWKYHFGSFLVESASDFGSRSASPTHPELLDYLAWTFMHEDRWSLKSLHRRIMLSHAYLQDSLGCRDANVRSAQLRDAQNVFLWRQNRQLLDLEAMRDSMLAVTGQLDPAIGGRPIPLESGEPNRRRTVYCLIDRNNLPSFFRTFDYPSPDTSSPGRPQTTVPQQALFLMNSPFVESISGQLAERIRQHNPEPAAQVEQLIQLVFARAAQVEEISTLSSYLETHSLEHLVQALLMTNEFLFVD